MFSNYLKITFRHFQRQRVHTGINLMGLAIGLACTILIALWIKRELSVNQFHQNKSNLFRVLGHQQYGEDIFTFSSTPGPLAEELKTSFPEITHASTVTWANRELLGVGEQASYAFGRYVDPDFLQLFTFPLVEGDPELVLTQPDHILITQELEDKFFPGEKALNKVIRLNNETEYKVAGVLENIPENSSLTFDFLLPIEPYRKQNEWLTTWTNNSPQTYFMTTGGTTPEGITQKIRKVVAEHGAEHITLLAQPLRDWYLRSEFRDGKLQGGRIDTIRMFGIIAAFILLIACINFMNLSTARSATRALEVGVRKVTGASRGMLAGQFLSESLVMACLAGITGMAMASMILPYFNRIFDLQLTFEQAGPVFWAGITGIIVLTGLLAGSYPAFLLSSFQPIGVLKRVIHPGGQAVHLRKVLVTAQFVISIILIISTLVVFSQLEYIRHHHLGYDKENLVYVPVNGTLWEKYETLKTELEQLPGVKSVSATNGQIHQWGNNTADVSWPGKNPEQSILFQTIPVEYDFLETIGASLKSGRDFAPAYSTDTSNYVINETAARLMGLENPVGQSMSLWENPGQIVGVVNDFHVGSLHQSQDPVILLLRPWKNFIYIRIHPTSEPGALLSALEKTFTGINPAYPFEYHFSDQEYEELHRRDQQTGSLAKVFASLAIFVSCLGLFGLATFATEQRRKEIGIRKVLGASVTHLTGLVSQEFMSLVGIAFLIACPIAWWGMDGWLQDFSFRIELRWWYFGIAGLLALVIAFLTVGTQSVKAALADPVQSLKNE